MAQAVEHLPNKCKVLVKPTYQQKKILTGDKITPNYNKYITTIIYMIYFLKKQCYIFT
jgi:hypothetical protein